MVTLVAVVPVTAILPALLATPLMGAGSRLRAAWMLLTRVAGVVL